MTTFDIRSEMSELLFHIKASKYGCLITKRSKVFLLCAFLSFLQTGFSQAPGGITANLRLWLKAGTGVTPNTQGASVTTWADQSSGANNATYVSPMFSQTVLHPTFQQSTINFNPSVRFPGTSATSFAALQGNFATAITSNNVSAYIVSFINSAASNSGRIFMISLNAGTSDWQNLNGADFLSKVGASNMYGTRNGTNAPQVGPVVGLPAFIGSSHFTAAGQFRVNFNGNPFVAQAFAASAFNASVYRLGISTYSGNDWLNGDIAEVVFYDADKSSSSADPQISTYLAVKYGIHKADNYINSAGTTIWDATANAAFHNDVFGIGQDNASGLLQTQSNSMNNGSGNGTGQSGKGNIVISNPSALTDQSFLMIGHNTNDFSIIRTNLPPSLATTYGRFNRSWYEVTTGTVGTVTLSFDATGIASLASLPLSSAKLIIDHDADGNFNTGTITVVPVSSVAGSILTFNNVSFSPAVFSLAFGEPLDVSGSVWDDPNGNVIKDGTEVSTNGGGSLYAVIVDKIAGTAVTSTPVAANGTFSFTGVIPQNSNNKYALILSTSPTGTLPSLPANYAFTGYDSAGMLAQTPLGVLNINSADINFSNISFGIEQLPITNTVTLNNIDNISVFNKTDQPGYLGAAMNNAALQPLSGTDAEDCPTGCSPNSTFVLTNINANTLIFYNGVPKVAGDIITNFNVSLMSIYGQFGSGTVANPIGFDYKLIDAAGKASTVAAPYRITTLLPLPVTLTSFTTKTTDCNNVLVTWTVANASNFGHFEVQRSLDGINFSSIRNIPFKQNEDTYEFKETNANGSYQYRLKLVDKNGTYKLSNVISVKVNCGLNSGLFVVPNPAKSQIQIKGISDKVNLQIVNNLGRTVIKAKNVTENDPVDISRLPANNYIIQVIQKGNIIANIQFIKE